MKIASRHRAPSRVCVSTVYVEPVQVWFRCPGCNATLGGDAVDPRGLRSVTCTECDTCFDIPARAAVVIT